MCCTSEESNLQVSAPKSDHYLSLFQNKTTVHCLRIVSHLCQTIPLWQQEQLKEKDRVWCLRIKFACVCVAYLVTVICLLQVCLWTGHCVHRRHLWETAHWWRNSGSSDRWCCRNYSSYCGHYCCDLQAELNLFHHIFDIWITSLFDKQSILLMNHLTINIFINNLISLFSISL